MQTFVLEDGELVLGVDPLRYAPFIENENLSVSLKRRALPEWRLWLGPDCEVYFDGGISAVISALTDRAAKLRGVGCVEDASKLMEATCKVADLGFQLG